MPKRRTLWAALAVKSSKNARRHSATQWTTKQKWNSLLKHISFFLSSCLIDNNYYVKMDDWIIIPSLHAGLSCPAHRSLNCLFALCVAFSHSIQFSARWHQNKNCVSFGVSRRCDAHRTYHKFLFGAELWATHILLSKKPFLLIQTSAQ